MANTQSDLERALAILETGLEIKRALQGGEPTTVGLHISARAFLEDLREEAWDQYEMLIAWCEGKGPLNPNLNEQLTRRHLMVDNKPHPILLKELGIEDTSPAV